MSGLAAIAAARVLVTIPFGRAIWDFVFVLDGAYRISLGQVPHVDFSSPIGPLTLYLTLAAEKLFPAGNPFVGMHALMWLLLLPALAALAPRFQSTLRFTTGFGLLALIVLLPMTLDSTHLSEISYFASYNRFATGLLFLVGLWYVLPKSRHDWLLLAYVLALLFFLKITAWAVALGIIVAAIVLRRSSVRTLTGAIAGFLAILLAAQAVTGLVPAYLADVKHMSGLNGGGAVYAFFFAGFRNWLALALAACLALAALLAAATEAGTRPVATIRTLLAKEAFAVDAVLLVAAALFAESQNTGGLGLIAASALFFHPAAWKARSVLTACLLAAILFPVLDIAVRRPLTAITREGAPAPNQLLSELLPGTRVPLSTFEGARLFSRIAAEWLPLAREVQRNGYFLTPDPTTNAPAVQLAWATSAVDAAHIFTERGYDRFAKRYVTLAFADPFDRMLHLTPAKGTALVMDVGRTIPVFTDQQARSYLASADGVFVERCNMGDEPNGAAFDAVLKAGFTRLPLNNCWDFFHRGGEN